MYYLDDMYIYNVHTYIDVLHCVRHKFHVIYHS